MNNKKLLLQRIAMLVLLATTVIFITLTIAFASKYKNANNLLDSFQQNSIVFTEDQQHLINDVEKDTFVLTVQDGDNETKLYIMKIEGFELDIYTALILGGLYKIDDFDSYDGVNYYFTSKEDGVFAKTDVLELQENEEYYPDEGFGPSLVVGLQAIVIDQNYTVVKGVW